MSKKIVSMMIIVCVGLMVGGLSSAAKAEDKVTLSYWNWHFGEVPPIMAELVARFERAHPNVKIEQKDINYFDLPKQIFIAAKANNLPDLMEVWQANVVPLLAKWGQIEPLDPYMEKEPGGMRAFLDDFYDGTYMRYYGNVYSLPVYADPFGFFWNYELFEKAGLDRNSPPRTWEKVKEYAVKLTIPEESQWGIGLNGADGEGLPSSAWLTGQLGGYIGLPPELGKVPDRKVTVEDVGINKSPAVQAYQWLYDFARMKVNGFRVTPNFAAFNSERGRELFYAGKIGMVWDGPWLIATGTAATEGKFMPFREYGVATLPVRKGSRPVGSVLVGDTANAMSTTCKDKALGWEFVKHMASEESATYYNANTANIPCRKSVSQRAELLANKSLQPFIKMNDEWENLGVYFHMPPQLEAALDVYLTEQARAFLGEKTTQEAMDAIAAGWVQLWNEW